MTTSSQTVNSTCRFCALRETRFFPVWDKNLDCDGNVKVIPTKGAIVYPWLLIVPNSHVPTAALLPCQEKLSVGRLIKRIRRMASSMGQNLIIFENGAPYFGSDISCGIEHVHIHMVALDFSLVEKLQTHLPKHVEGLEPWSPLANLPNTPYIYVDDGTSQIYFDASNSPSQFVRQLIAAALDCADEFHYDLFPQIENTIRTVEWFDHASNLHTLCTGGAL